MEGSISQLSNDELYEKLKHYGIAKGPVTSNICLFSLTLLILN